MASVLPKSFKKKIQSEYRLRLITVISILISMSFLAGVVLLIPAYILADAELQTLEGRTLEVKRAGEEIVSKESQDEAVWTRELLLFVASQSGTREIEPLIRTIINEIPTGIRVMRMEYLKGESEVIKLSGVAADRRSLTEFSSQLSSLSEVEEVDLPLSNLVKSTDIPFSLDMIIVNDEVEE